MVAITFLDTEFILRNPANTASLTLRNPTFTGDGETSLIEPYNYFVYVDVVDGNKIKAKNGITRKIDYTSTNDAGAVLASIFLNHPANTPLVVVVGPGDFPIRSWEIGNFRRSNFLLEGSGMGVTNFIVYDDLVTVAGDNRCFAFEANGAQFPVNDLSSNAAKNAATVSVNSNTNLSAGNYIVIRATDLWEAELAGTAQKTEVNRIVSISGTGPYVVVLEKRTRDSYDTVNAASIRRIDYLVNLTLRDFTIKAASTFTRTDVNFMRFDWCDNRTIERVELVNFNGNYHKGLVDNLVINSRVSGMRFYIEPQMGNFVELGPYAISCRGACENIQYTDCNFHGGIRHAFTTTTNSETGKYGIPRNIFIENCNSDTTGECSFDTHGEGDAIYFINCSVHSFRNAGAVGTTPGTDDTDPFNTRCKNTTFDHCKVYNTWGNGITTSAPGYGHQIINCYVRNVAGGTNKGISIGTNNTMVRDCNIEDTDGPAIWVDGSRVKISDTHIKNASRSDTTRAAIRVNTGRTGVKITGCDIEDCPDNAIRFEGSNDNATINDNDIIDCGQANSVPAVYINNSQNCLMNINRIDMCDRPVQTAGTSNRLVYTGNNTRGNDNPKTLVGANNVKANNIE